jgi:hypothetical protein
MWRPHAEPPKTTAVKKYWRDDQCDRRASIILRIDVVRLYPLICLSDCLIIRLSQPGSEFDLLVVGRLSYYS